jgi:predicted DNA-binding transcriptional regulator AlpA
MDQKRRLLSVTLEEYNELLRQLKTDLRFPKTDKPQDKLSDFIYLDEVMEITGYKKSTVYSKVSKNEMPVISRRRPLTFSRKELHEWMSLGRLANKLK